MPKYLMVGSYSVEGAKGLLKDGGSKQRQVAEAALKSIGGTVESFYSAFGDNDPVHHHRRARQRVDCGSFTGD